MVPGPICLASSIPNVEELTCAWVVDNQEDPIIKRSDILFILQRFDEKKTQPRLGFA
jgi:hypothetical protein